MGVLRICIINKVTPRTRTHRLERKFVGFLSDPKQEKRCVSFGPYRPLRGHIRLNPRKMCTFCRFFYKLTA